jgi:hypothetical protein
LTDVSTDSPPSSFLDHYDPASPAPTLFEHSRRQSWGLGIVLKKQRDRIQLRFQDGRTRTFKHGYYHLIDVVDRPLDVALRVTDALEAMGDVKPARRSTRRSEQVSLDEQIALFGRLYEGGFQGDDYVAQHRSDGRRKPLKRHREGLLTLAEPLRTPRGDGNVEDRFAAAVALVKATDLVGAKERKAFAGIAEDAREGVVDGIDEVLHGEGPLAPRFDRFVRLLETAMGKAPSWGLATLFRGTVFAKDDLVVRRRAAALQAAWMAPGLAIGPRPMGLVYERLSDMAGRLRETLVEAGLSPRDGLDLIDFMWLTLKPAAVEEVLEARARGGLVPIATAA